MTKPRPPKDILERRKTPSQPHKRIDVKASFDWKFWLGMVVGIPGTLATIVALWLTVVDRPTVSVGPLGDPADLMSTQITLTNGGMLPIRDVTFATYVPYLHDALKDRSVDHVGGAKYEPPTGVLLPGEPVTTSFGAMIGSAAGLLVQIAPPVRFDKADIVLIATFRPAWAPFWKRMRVFRFKSVHLGDQMVMQQVPAEDIEEEYKNFIGH